MAFNWCEAGSVGCRLRVLATSVRSALLEVSRSIRRAIRLLVRSRPTSSCILVNSAMNAQARVRSSSRTLPVSYIDWRRSACTRAKICCVLSITHCLGKASPLPSASTGRDFSGADASVGDASAPSDPSSRHNAACLASHSCWSMLCVKGRMRSETMFQWSLDGGLRVIATFVL